jgi:hypothetical protein
MHPRRSGPQLLLLSSQIPLKLHLAPLSLDLLLLLLVLVLELVLNLATPASAC